MELKYDKHNKYHRMARSVLVTALSLWLFWWAWLMIALFSSSVAIPTPMETFAALSDFLSNGDVITGKSAWDYISASLIKFLEGFLLAFVVAVPLGLVLGNFALLRELATPIIEVLRPIAPIAWAPIFILLFRYQFGAILVVFVGIFFPLLTNIIFGVQKIDKTLIDAAKTLGASNLQIFIKILVPSTIPYIMNGIKVGLGIGWMCIVAAELYANPLGGIGFYVANMITYSAYPEAFAGLVIIAVLGLMTTGLADLLHRKVSKRMGVDA
ncbi:MAG: ABC transporter permease [Thermoplasmata archaeon]|nr:ABC transporter permease [Thermoplasmata archaeon]